MILIRCVVKHLVWKWGWACKAVLYMDFYVWWYVPCRVVILLCWCIRWGITCSSEPCHLHEAPGHGQQYGLKYKHNLTPFTNLQTLHFLYILLSFLCSFFFCFLIFILALGLYNFWIFSLEFDHHSLQVFSTTPINYMFLLGWERSRMWLLTCTRRRPHVPSYLCGAVLWNSHYWRTYTGTAPCRPPSPWPGCECSLQHTHIHCQQYHQHYRLCKQGQRGVILLSEMYKWQVFHNNTQTTQPE